MLKQLCIIAVIVEEICQLSKMLQIPQVIILSLALSIEMHSERMMLETNMHRHCILIYSY